MDSPLKADNVPVPGEELLSHPTPLDTRLLDDTDGLDSVPATPEHSRSPTMSQNILQTVTHALGVHDSESTDSFSGVPQRRRSMPGRPTLNHQSSSSSSTRTRDLSTSSLNSIPGHKRELSTSKNRKIIGESLTNHTAFYDIPVSDAFSEMLERYIPAEDLPQRDSPASLDQDKAKNSEMLVGLVMNNMWRSVARYARQKIVQHDPEQLEEILQLWYLRLLALTKLGLYQLASAELDKLGDLKRPELTYQYHADLYPNKHGCMVPFELRVLWACLPALMKHPLLTLERITMLAVHCKKMQKTDASQVNIWQRREVQMYLVLSTRFMEMNDYTGAASTMEMILDKYATAENGEQDIDILSGLARLYLQLGDISSAQNLYTRLESQYQGNDAPSVTECIQINRALLCIAKADWKQARDILLEIYQTNKENLLVMHNLAVCEVYMGNLNKAIAILETLTTDNPTSAGTCETALMNMCTLYELRYANPTDKKVAVMKQVARWIGDSFQSNCFKLQ